MPDLRLAPALMLLVALGGCGGGGDGGPTPPPPPKVSTVALSLPDTTINVGASFTISATPRDSKGATVGATVTWASSDAGVARVENGLVTAVGAGFAVITATAGGVSARVALTVLAPIAAIEVTGPAPSMGVGGTMQLTATMRDATGAVRIDRTPTWASSDTNVAAVSGTGLVTAKAVGTSVISATTESVTGRYALAITTAVVPTIGAVSPATLTPGATATISGTDFDPTLTGNVVTVDGLQATVTAVTPTQLTVRLPAAFACKPAQPVAVRVTTPGGTASGSAAMRFAVQRTPAVGTLLTIANPADFGCVELQGSGSRYLLAVVNTSESPSSRVSNITVSGRVPAGAAPAAISAVRLPTAVHAPRVPGPTVAAARQLASLQTLEQSRAVLRRVRREIGAPRALARRGARTRAARLRATTTTASRGSVGGIAGAGTASATAPKPTRIPTVVGDTTTVRLRSASDCSTYTNIVARAVYVGAHSVVLEDSKAPLAGTMDGDYQRLGQEFDQVMFPILTRDFGDPLALDSLTNNDQRIAMLFTPEVNARSANLLGFVSACDFFAPDAATWIGASNQAEIFYARAATNSTGTASDVNSRDGWFRYMRSTLVHETKHIASFAERILRTPDDAPDLILEESWLEEGTAQIAVELYARTIYGAGLTWKGSALYRQTLYCDWSSRYALCGNPPILMLDHFAFLQDYLANVDSKSFLSSGTADNDIYGSAWLFARWAADTYAQDEGAFFRALVTDWQRAGIANIRARTNATWDTMLANFMTALWATGRAGVTPSSGSQFVVPSWNLADIFAGMNADNSRFAAQPLRQVTSPLGNFDVPVARVNGGSASFIELTAPTPVAGQIVSVRDPAGVPFGSATTLQLAVLRVQ
ncbi:MAG: Ig-like domain-containing protein [Gemmatimonadaceae bacterium]